MPILLGTGGPSGGQATTPGASGAVTGSTWGGSLPPLPTPPPLPPPPVPTPAIPTSFSLPSIPTPSAPPAPSIPRVQARPTTPPPLPPEYISSFGRRRNAASSGYKTALAQAEAERGRVDERAQLSISRLLEAVGRQRETGLDEFGSQGLATQPRFAGNFLRDLLEQRQTGEADIEMQRMAQRRALEEMIQQARRARDLELARISEEEALARAGLVGLR